MDISMYSVNSPQNESKLNEPFNFYFLTQINLTKLNPHKTTFQDLLFLLYKHLEYNPPRKIWGKRCIFRVHQVIFWAKIGNHCFLYKISLPSESSARSYPPLAKIDGTYRVHFCTTHTILGHDDR